MTSLWRARTWRSVRRVAVVAVATAVAGTAALSPGAAARATNGGPAAHTSSRVVIDHIALDLLPAGLGAMSEFRYDYAGVDFVSGVWESRTTQGWQVDLDVAVLRGAHLRTPRAFRLWFTAYQARDPEPTYLPFRVHGHPGWLAKDQLFWLIRPGLAVSVQLDHARWPTYDVVRAAWAAHRVRRARAAPSA